MSDRTLEETFFSNTQENDIVLRLMTAPGGAYFSIENLARPAVAAFAKGDAADMSFRLSASAEAARREEACGFPGADIDVTADPKAFLEFTPVVLRSHGSGDTISLRPETARQIAVHLSMSVQAQVAKEVIAEEEATLNLLAQTDFKLRASGRGAEGAASPDISAENDFERT